MAEKILKTYRVDVPYHAIYSYYVKAESAKAAKEQARKKSSPLDNCDDGSKDFKWSGATAKEQD